MSRFPILLTGAGLGAGAMYFFDPVLGHRRRALLRDQITHAMSKASRGADAALRDVEHRLYGTFAELRGCFGSDAPSDEVLASRVRSKMGRYVSHPSAIAVTARGGSVTLTGPILAQEVDDLLTAIKAVRGVEHLENRLTIYRSSENDITPDAAKRRRNGREKEQRQWRAEHPIAGEAAVLRQSWRVTQ